jgi:hypothetical protein
MTAPGQWPPSTGLLVAFCGAAATTAVVVVLGGTREQDAALAAFAALTVAVAARSAPLAAPGIGMTAWMFDNGFLVNRHAHLVWHGAADATRLGVLLGVAACAAAAGWVVRSRGSGAGSRTRESAPCAVVDLGEIRDRRRAAEVAPEQDAGTADTADG